jgi:hypothetical protein
MSASAAGGSSTNAIGFGAEAIDGTVRSMTQSRVLPEANLRAETSLFEHSAARENVALVAAGPATTIRSA